MSDQTPQHEFVERVQRIRSRRVRARGQATLAERKAFERDPTALRARLKLWSDPTIGSIMHDSARELTRRRAAITKAAAAWRDLLPRDFAAPTELVGLSRGVLTVCVPDHASKFTLDRILRAGGLTHFIRSVPIAIKDVRIVVGIVRETIVPVESRGSTIDDAERDEAILARRQPDIRELRAMWNRGGSV